MERAADVGTVFVAYLIEEFKKKAAGADYLLENWQGIDQKDAGRLIGAAGVNVLIEFRTSKGAWSEELAKPFRQEWCQRLTHVPSLRELADRCHFVAWDGGASAEIDALLAVYSSVCAPQLMVREGGASNAGSETHTMFTHAYLQRRRGTSNHGLQEYLTFIASLADDAAQAVGNFDFEVLWLHAREGKLLGCWINDFFTLFALAEWLNDRLGKGT